MKKISSQFPIIFLILITISLRLVNLGYSDYQGDEIKALFIPDQGQSISSFLLDQRKGPIQFVITFLVKFINNDYSNELITRLPFAIAGILSVFVFYKFASENFNRKVSLYATVFMATNGFLIAFSRIVQYQSFVILFMALTLYFVSKSVSNENWKVKGLIIGMICWGISILSHYDGAFIAPFIFYFLYNHYIKYKNLKSIILSGVLLLVLLIPFYIPFALSLSSETKDYWQNRISGGQGKISSSRYLFSVYQPIYVIHIYTILSVFGFIYLGYLSLLHIKALKFKTSFREKALYLLNYKFLWLFIWLFIPFVFMEFLINIPGTHIYTYIIPGLIILGYGILLIEESALYLYKSFIQKLVKLLPRTISLMLQIPIYVIFLFLFLQANAIFVDHSKEYPWQDKKFLIWNLNKPSAIFHLSMFGFPYYRNWEGISSFILADSGTTYYSSNERVSITRYYLPINKDTDKAGYYVHIRNPQSFTDEILNAKANYWSSKYQPVLTYNRGEEQIVALYKMNEGSLSEIKKLGF